VKKLFVLAFLMVLAPAGTTPAADAVKIGVYLPLT
jgi:hypothetical protein